MTCFVHYNSHISAACRYPNGVRPAKTCTLQADLFGIDAFNCFQVSDFIVGILLACSSGGDVRERLQ